MCACVCGGGITLIKTCRSLFLKSGMLDETEKRVSKETEIASVKPAILI